MTDKAKKDRRSALEEAFEKVLCKLASEETNGYVRDNTSDVPLEFQKDVMRHHNFLMQSDKTYSECFNNYVHAAQYREMYESSYPENSTLLSIAWNAATRQVGYRLNNVRCMWNMLKLLDMQIKHASGNKPEPK
jgi:hypothetical protein